MNALFVAARHQGGSVSLTDAVANIRLHLEGGPCDDSNVWDIPPSLARLAQLFELSYFEAQVLLLCAARELDGSVAALCAAAHGDASRPWPTFGLALARLPGAHWSALTPEAALRRWQLVTIDTTDGLATGRLAVVEPVLHALKGLSALEERTAALLRPTRDPPVLAGNHAAAAEVAARAWQSGGRPPVIELVGDDVAALSDVAARIASLCGWQLFALASADVPTATDSAAPLLRAIDRDLRLSGGAVLIEAGSDATRVPTIAAQIASPLIVAAGTPIRGWRHPSLRLNIDRPEGAEERALWRTVLPDTIGDAEIAHVIGRFRLPASGIVAVGQRVCDAGEAFWQACREEAAGDLGGLAERITPRARWDDLVLPDAQQAQLASLAAHLRQRATVHDTWGFATRGRRGLGITALFAGGSGTGKTMSAEILAGIMGLDLYCVDLSQIVSKWLGETEKHLARIFRGAEAGGAVLLFDEADALFGKRSDVRDSHDRYANVEVSYLLQRMESYRGLAVLTTNNEQSLDQAFVRRLRTIIQFPFPDAAQRERIWQCIFPPQTPTEGLQFDKLARLAVAGGAIRNVALTAAFIAADAGQPVRMRHLKEAADIEGGKTKRMPSARETGDWL